MIHHETFSGKYASEMDGVGHFNVIERGPCDFIVAAGDGGITLSEHDHIEGACGAAQRQADKFDEEVLAARRRDEAKTITPDMPKARRRAALLLTEHLSGAQTAAELAGLQAVVAELMRGANA